MRSFASLLSSSTRGRHGLLVSDSSCRETVLRVSPVFIAPAVFLLLALCGCGKETPAALAPNAAEASLPAAGEPTPAATPSAAVPAATAAEPTPAGTPPAAAPVAPVVELKSQEKPAVKSAEPAQVPAPGPEARSLYKSGEDPEFARQCGWPVTMPEPLPGAILPAKRLIAYYGNPNSRRMGVLGEYEKDEMLRRLRVEVEAWEKADPSVPVQPALHLIAVVAQGKPGKAGKYRMVMPDEVVNRVYGWAREAGALLFIDIQTGQDDIRALLPRFEWILKNPDVHLGIDPEFNMGAGGPVPGSRIGTYDAADINYAADFLADLVRRYNLPPKVFIVHRFTRPMVTNARQIKLHPEVQVVMHMDGWGAPWLKRDSYKDYIVSEPVQYTGFKLFYHNDTKKGDALMLPEEVLRLNPKPLYVQYQ